MIKKYKTTKEIKQYIKELEKENKTVYLIIGKRTYKLIPVKFPSRASELYKTLLSQSLKIDPLERLEDIENEN